MGSTQILLVDDEAQLLQLMRRYLERLGYDTLTAATTQEGWELFEQNVRPTVAVIDVTLDGIELARRMLAGRPETRVILTSGYAADTSALESAFPGRVRFVQKPFSGDMLAEAVGKLA